MEDSNSDMASLRSPEYDSAPKLQKSSCRKVCRPTNGGFTIMTLAHRESPHGALRCAIEVGKKKVIDRFVQRTRAATTPAVSHKISNRINCLNSHRQV